MESPGSLLAVMVYGCSGHSIFSRAVGAHGRAHGTAKGNIDGGNKATLRGFAIVVEGKITVGRQVRMRAPRISQTKWGLSRTIRGHPKQRWPPLLGLKSFLRCGLNSRGRREFETRPIALGKRDSIYSDIKHGGRADPLLSDVGLRVCESA